MAERHRSIVDVHLILRCDGKILMGRRANTGYGDGLLHLPSGHLERGESVVTGVIRETYEEIGVVVAPEALRCRHVMHRNDPTGYDRVGFFFEADRWAGEPVNREPDKCSELVWVDPDALPDDVIAYPAAAVAQIQRGTAFSLHGWDTPIP
ncbi:NUDIX domain-containing protein [Planosporangium thailandense]|uniref:NUDIX domain-containing protein n=1 Tax=Planosporangium thailandense TaxID=765197 RepID=A0ABX0XQ47_9ACTN|nr:NUDIX domain-containing protein [Planosporangium thailandense]